MNFVLKVIVVLLAGVAAIGALAGAYEAFHDELSKMAATVVFALVTLYCASRLTLFLLRSHEVKYSKTVIDLYKILVEEPPSNGEAAALGAKELEIGLNELPAYFRKRTITLEAMLYIAAITTFKGNKVQLVTEIEDVLKSKWLAKGLITDVGQKIHDYCWDEVEQLFENRVAWSKMWLDEFYSEPEDYGPCLHQWSLQCHQEFKTMVCILKNYEDI